MDAVIGYLIYAFIVETYQKKQDDDISTYIEEMESKE